MEAAGRKREGLLIQTPPALIGLDPAPSTQERFGAELFKEQLHAAYQSTFGTEGL